MVLSTSGFNTFRFTFSLGALLFSFLNISNKIGNYARFFGKKRNIYIQIHTFVGIRV